MTREQFKEIQNVVEEIYEIEKFLPIFKDCWRNEIVTTKRGATSLDSDRKIPFRVLHDSNLQSVIVKALENRLKELNELLEKA